MLKEKAVIEDLEIKRALLSIVEEVKEHLSVHNRGRCCLMT